MTPTCPGMLSDEYLASDKIMSLSVLENAVHFNLSTQYSRSWGNALGPYWNARGLAALTGMTFVMDNTFKAVMGEHASWLAELPTFVEAAAVTSVSIQHAAIICQETSKTFPGCWHYPFGCTGHWMGILPTIQADSRAALLGCVSMHFSIHLVCTSHVPPCICNPVSVLGCSGRHAV